MNDQKSNESQKLIMRENLSSPLNREKARRLVLKDAKIKNDHIFDKLNFLGIPEETSDKSNNYNSNVNLINDSAGDLNPEGKNPKKGLDPQSNTKRKINVIDLSPKESIVTVKFNHDFKNKNNNDNNENNNFESNFNTNGNNFNKSENLNNAGMQEKNFSVNLMPRNNRINKSYNFEKLNFKNNSSSNCNLNNLKNSANSNSNIYIRNSNINLNSLGENRLSKIYKEDSFNSKKTLEIIKRRKSTMPAKSELSEPYSADKSLGPYFETFKDFFKDEKIIKQKLYEILQVLNANKVLEKIKLNLNIMESDSDNEDYRNKDKAKYDEEPRVNRENKNVKLSKNNKKKTMKDSSEASNKNVYTDAESTMSNEKEKRKAKNKSKTKKNNKSNNNISKSSDKSLRSKEYKSEKEKEKRKGALKKNSNQDQILNSFENDKLLNGNNNNETNINNNNNNNNKNENENEDANNNQINQVNLLNEKNKIIESYNYKNNNDYSYLNNNLTKASTSNFSYNHFGKNPIGPICEMEKIYFLCQLKNAKSEIAKISKDLAYWRLVLGDGNCFYRAFIFSLLEIWVLQSNLKNLEKLICDFFAVLEVEKNNPLIKQNPFSKVETGGILILILNQLRQKNKRKAYEIFLKAYQKYKSFDIGLIIYMRLVLFNYISKHKNFYYNLESQIEIGHLLPNEYIDDVGNFQFDDFFNSFLLRINSEAEKIIIYLSPIIFGVDLDLFILEGLAKAKYSGFNDNNNNNNLYNDIDNKRVDNNNNLNIIINDNYAQNNHTVSHSKNNNICGYNDSEIKLIKEQFPCYGEEYLKNEEHKHDLNTIENNNNYSKNGNLKFPDHPSSRNKYVIASDSNYESGNLNNYFNSKMLMTIREKEDGLENNNDEKEAEVPLDDNQILQTHVDCIEGNKDELDHSIKNCEENEFEEKEELKEKVEFGSKKEKAFNTISLLYRSAHYDKVYTLAFTEHFRNFDFKNSDIFIFNSVKDDLFSDRKIDVEESFCPKCDKNVKKISFKHLKEFGFAHCQKCLIDIVNSEFKDRVKSFIAENFNNLEYYCRPIKIDTEKDLELYDQDIMSLYRESIHQHFIRLIEKTCLNCFNEFEDFRNDFVFFNCRCKLCKLCVVEKIKNLTQGKFILNNFEKRKILSTFYIDCVCSNKIDVNYALHNTINHSDLVFWEGKAAERFKEVIKRHCLNCKNLIKTKSNKQKTKEKPSKKNKDKTKNNQIDNNTLEEKELKNNNYNSNNNNLNNQKQNLNVFNSEKNWITEGDKDKDYNLAYNKNSYVKYYNFPIIPPHNKIENPIEESFDPHLICDLCVDIVNQEILNKMRLRSRKGKTEVFRIVEIKCILCLKDHNVEYKNIKKFVKTGFQRCCSVL